jgi:prevent-host-death family protein
MRREGDAALENVKHFAADDVLTTGTLSAIRKDRQALRLVFQPYVPYSEAMPKKTYGAEEARTLLPELLERAHHGSTSVITKRGKPYAAIVPVVQTRSMPRISILALSGSGEGLWGKQPSKTVDALRDEWS